MMVSDERDRDDDVHSQDQQHIKLPPCSNNLATALLTDAYQITMAYAY